MQKETLKKRNALFAGGIILLILFFTWMSKTQTPAEKQPQAIIVQTTRTQKTDSHTTIEIAGFVRGAERAEVAPLASGTITKILKHEGETVKEGELLAIIDSKQTEAQINSLNSNISALKKTVIASEKYYNQLVNETEKKTDATKEEIESAEKARNLQIQSAKDQLISAEGMLEIAQAGKDNFMLKAPFAGTITHIYGRVGGFASFATPLLSISNPNNFEIETYVSASQAPSISLGTIVNLQTAQGAPLSGTVVAISAGSDSANFKTLLRIQLDTDPKIVRLGDFLRGQLTIASNKKTISIPRSAIVLRGGDQFVFILDEDKIAKQQNIKTGNEADDSIEVLEGLAENQEIVIEGQQHLLTGSKTTTYETK